jgi:chromate reductase
MSQLIHVLGFAGSLRRASYNAGLLRAAAELLPEGMSLEIFDLSPIPLFNADVEAAGLPQPVQQFKARIAAANALLIVTPEYNYSIPGVLKNAIDWASRPVKESPLNGKPLAMMGAGGMSGTMRAQQHLRLVAVHNNLLVLNQPEVYVARAWEKFDPIAGDLKDDKTRQLVRELMVALAAWTRRVKLSADG